MEGEKKVTDCTIVKIQIPYTRRLFDFRPGAAYKGEFYSCYAKVCKVKFQPNGKLNVTVEIGVLSAKDFKTP